MSNMEYVERAVDKDFLHVVIYGASGGIRTRNWCLGPDSNRHAFYSGGF